MSIAKGVSPILCSLSGNRKPLGVSSTSAHSCMYAPSEVSSCGSDSAYPHFSDGALNNARVVLVGTQHAGNVGSVCRAAVNFECKDIYVVDGACDLKSQECFNAAANTLSRTLLDQIHIKESLSEAIDDCSMAIAFTRRTGKTRLPSFTLNQLTSPENKNIRLALVFGREDCGLHTQELLQCTHVCAISTGSWQGSLNLSHAVTVVLSRLFESWAPVQDDIYLKVRPDSVAHKTLPGTASVSEVENLLHRWEDVFALSNYLVKQAAMPEFKTPDRLFLFLRKLLQRGRPSAREVAYLHGFLTVVENLAKVVSRTEESMK